jgi:hypothetical protein
MKSEWGLKRRIILKDGTEKIFLKHTKDYTTKEMNEYWERLWQFASEELNIFIPEPNFIDLEYLEYN